MEEKRVACLYRVSTKMQVEKDDIPMQKIACKEFISRMPGWILVKEYSEKGVSGYKKKAADRDVLQQVRTDASNKMFDILLVFMFDRLGRREDETPFIVEWFVAQGIEVWSTREGQQKFDNRADKLINYIRYWQAGGESEKTSIRVKERQTQLAKEGIYMSGIPPYGYTLVRSGIFTKHGKERKILQIDPKEAEIVKLIYSLSLEMGYGGLRISKYLNERNIPSRKGTGWTLSVVNYMLRNPVYKGYIAYNKTSVKKNGTQGRIGKKDWVLSEEKNEDIAIISEEDWDKVQRIRLAKTPSCYQDENMDYESYPLQTKGKGLFTGFIKCGHCGFNMSANSNQKKVKLKDGTIKSEKMYTYYRCTAKTSGHIKCTSKKMTYQADKIEKIVLKEIYKYLDSLKSVDLTEEIEKLKRGNVSDDEIKLKQLNKQIISKTEANNKLKEEIVKCLLGQSNFDEKILNELIKNNDKEIETITNEKEVVEKRVQKKQIEYNEMKKVQKMIPVWKEEFEKAPIEVKKMLLSQIISQIYVFENKIQIEMRVDLDTFFNKDKKLENLLKSG